MAKKSETSAVKKLLKEVVRGLSQKVEDPRFKSETPIEVESAMLIAIYKIESAIELLSAEPETKSMPLEVSVSNIKGPTRVQGQYLAYIKEFMARNQFGIAPTHAELQWYFQSTPPTVNSMLKKLDELSYIEREPGVARSIKITIAPELIPKLERPFKHR